MAQTLPGVTILLGTSAADASANTRGTDNAHPYVAWQLPAGFTQRRFNVRVASAEPGGWAYTTSGIQTTSDRQFQFPFGVGLNNNFAGLCTVSVALSQVSSGEMEWVSEPAYFVYDPILERLYNSGQVTVTWHAGTNPDALPSPGGRLFHLQIARDPLFANLVYEIDDLSQFQGATVVHPVPVEDFVPGLDRTYFYRVRQSDSLDFGAWSRVHCFSNYLDVPPTVTILDVTDLNTDDGDHLITLYIEDPDSDQVFVSLSYEVPTDEDRQPLSFTDSPLVVPTGTRYLLWRTRRSFPDDDVVNDVVLYATAYNRQFGGPEAFYGPITLDNTQVPDPGGGFGANALSYPIVAHLARRPSSDLVQVQPADGVLGVRQFQWQEAEYPVYAGPYLWPQAAMIAPLESRNDADDAGGGGFRGWNSVIKGCWDANTRSALLAGYTTVSFPSGGGQLNPHATANRWLFTSPIDYHGQTDAWPRPFNSREMTRVSMLSGYLDFNGNVVHYPDGYDWDARPDWHAGREVYVTGDAWVQLAHLGRSEYPVCSICAGRHWVPVADGHGYTRTACSNPDCLDGFDHGQPPEMAHGRARMSAYLRPVWYRLSHLGLDWLLDGEDLSGLPVYLPPPPQQTSGETAWAVAGYLGVFPDATDAAQGYPTDGQITLPTAYDDGPGKPVSGEHGPLRDSFFWGVDPDSHPGHANRPQPPQAWNVLVGGQIGRIYQAYPLSFRFLQAWWDAYNTVHFRATGSQTSMYHLQVARYTEGGTLGAWSDVLGDNMVYDAAARRYLVPPLTFYAYWNTSSRALFPAGGRYKLRVRQYDVLSHSFSDWAYSGDFQILADTPNPVSVTSLDYEPWSKRVTIAFRLDDTQAERYTLTRYWYSSDDGITWRSISAGDISGQTSYLSSTPGSNTHTLYWDTVNYALAAGDQYRVKIECLPVGWAERLTLPFFKWYAPTNPVTDPAEAKVQAILGRTDSFAWDADSDRWVKLGEPVYTPGQLRLLELERERVRNHSDDPLYPSGYYGLVDDQGQVIDASGYALWLDQTYAGDQTHGQSLARVNFAIDDLVNHDLPEAHAAIFAGEVACRKDLIDQGYYAEQHFQVDASGHVSETVITHPLVNQYNNVSPSGIDVTRYWRFRVQAVPEGPNGIYDDDGYLDPQDRTPLEAVYYRLELDPALSFASQARRRPLRTVLYNRDGQRLTVSRHQVPDFTARQNPAVDDPRDQAGPWDGEPSDEDLDQFSGTSGRSQRDTVTLGGSVKLPPDQLPGAQDADLLPDGQDQWGGTHYWWRVCAYNAIVGPVSARPRPLITGIQPYASQDIAVISYEAQAHPMVQTMSLTAYQVSTATTTPVWTDYTAIDHVSDRRAPDDTDTGTINQYAWVPSGGDRRRPAILYDPVKCQYVLFAAKQHFSHRWRPVQSRGMALPTVCEYEACWDSRAETAIYGPALALVDETLHLYLTAQSAGLPYLMRSTSTDADSFSDPQSLTGLGAGAYPSVVYLAGVYHLWYEKSDAGTVKIFYATSTDGLAFTPQNGGAAVYSASGGVGSPSVIRLNGAWVMYFSDLDSGVIASVVSDDGISWSSRQTEIVPRTILDDGVPVTGTPCYPCAYLDRYRGNEELFLLFNFLLPNGEGRIYRARLEDRTWSDGADGQIFGAAGHLTEVPASWEGTERACSVKMAVNGIAPDSDLKIRLLFEDYDPVEYEFHRRSEWVTAQNAESYGSYLDPVPWWYEQQLAQIPYMDF